MIIPEICTLEVRVDFCVFFHHGRLWKFFIVRILKQNQQLNDIVFVCQKMPSFILYRMLRVDLFIDLGI